jgi:hypothetical protein
MKKMGWESAAGKTTACRLGDWGDGGLVPIESKTFSCPCCPDRLCGPFGLLSGCYVRDLPGGKEAWERGLLLAYDWCQTKEMWIYASSSSYVIIAQCLIS